MKKRFCVLLLAIFTLFGVAACGGDPYEKVKLTVSSNELNITMVEGENNELVSEPQRLIVDVDAPKSISKDIELPKYGGRLGDEFVSVEVKENNEAGHYVLEFKGVKTGYTELPIKTAEGNRTEIIKIRIDVEVKEMAFKNDVELVCEEGGKLDINGNSRRYINFTPSATSQTEVKYYISEETRRLYHGQGSADKLIKDNVLDLKDFKISENSELVDGEGNCYIKLGARSAIEGKEDITTKDTYLRVKVIKPFKFYSNTNTSTPTAHIVFSVGAQNTFNSVEPNEKKEDQVEYDLLFANPNLPEGEKSGAETIGDKYFFGGQIRMVLNYTDYKVTVDDLGNEIIGVTKVSTSISGGSTTFVFDVEPREAGNQTLVFKVDYTGGKSTGEYDGQFTKKIVVNFKVINVPTATNLKINDESYNPEKMLMVFKDYSSTFGTKLKVYDSSATDMTFKINTMESTIVVMNENGTVVDTSAGSATEFANGTTLYLKSSSNDTFTISIVLTMTSKFYTDNYGQGKEAQIYTKDVNIKVHVSASISDFNLTDKTIIIEKSADLQPTLIYEFTDTNITARDVISEVRLTNGGSGRVTFEGNKVFFTPNFKLDKYFTPSGTELKLVMITGISSSCRINVGLKYVDELLLLDVDKNNTGFFASWNSDSEGAGELTSSVSDAFTLSRDSVKYMDLNGMEHTYTFFDYLVLATNTTINFDVYRLFLYNGNIEKVAVNEGVEIDTNTSYVRWVKNEGGKLITTATATTSVKDGKFVSTPLVIHVNGIANPIIINTYVFEKISNAKLSKNTFTVYDATNLKDADIAKAFAEIQLKITTASGDDMFDMENYGNLYQNYTMNNATDIVTKLGATTVSYGDLVGDQHVMSFIEVGGTRYYRVNVAENINWYKTVFDASEANTKTIPNLDGLKYATITANEVSKTYYLWAENWYESIDDIIYETVEDSRRIEDIALINNLNDAKKETFRLNTVYTYEAKLSGAVSTENREALINAIFKEGFVEVVFRGTVKQFNNVFEGNNFVLRIYNPTKSTSIKTTVNKENGLYLELDGEKTTSFTYEVLPTNTFNKDVFVEIADVKTGEKVNVAFAIYRNGILNYRNYKTCGEFINGTYNNDAPLFKVTLKNNQVVIEYLGTTAGKYICTVGAVDQISDGQFNLKTEFNINVADGTQENPYQIRSRSDFEKYLQGTKVINGETTEIADKYYVLANDIILNNVITNPNYVLKNNLSGIFTKYISKTETLTYKYKIYGLNMLFTSDSINTSFGLFADVRAGITLDHVNFENVNVTVRGDFNREISIGVIAGNVNSSLVVKNSRVNGTITVVQNGSGAVNVGGMFGKTNGKVEVTGAPSESTINNSNINANIAISVSTLQGNNNDINVGGIVGFVGVSEGNFANISEVNVLARLTALKYEKANSTVAMDFAKANIGGVVGYAQNITINKAIVYPVIAGHSNVGGIAGYVQYAEINDSQVQMLYNINMKNIIAGYNNVGGVVGTAENARLEYTYVRSYTSQDINTYDGNVKVMEAMTSKYLGAVVVLQNNSPEFATGQYIGGLVGAVTKVKSEALSLTINNSYFNSHIASNAYASQERAGAFVGFKFTLDNGGEDASIKIENSYFDGKANVNNMLKLVFADARAVADTNNKEYTSEPTTYTYNILGDKNLNEHSNYVVVQETAVSKTTFKINETLDSTTISKVYAKLNGSLFTIEQDKNIFNDKISYFGLTTKVSESTIIVFRNNSQLRLSAYRRDLASSPLADSYEYYRLEGSSEISSFDSYKVDLLQSLIGYNFINGKADTTSLLKLKTLRVDVNDTVASETQNDIIGVLAKFGGTGSTLAEQVASINTRSEMKKVESGKYAYDQTQNKSNVVYNESITGEIVAIGERAAEFKPIIKFTYEDNVYYINTNNWSNVYSDKECLTIVRDFNEYWLANVPEQKTIETTKDLPKEIALSEEDGDIVIDGNKVTRIFFIPNNTSNPYEGKLYYYSGVKMYVYGDVILSSNTGDTCEFGGKIYTKLIAGTGMLVGNLYQYGGYESGYYATIPLEDDKDSSKKVIHYYEGNPTIIVKSVNSTINPNGTVTITIGGVDYTLENGVLVDAAGQEFNLSGGNRYYVNEKLNINIENKVLTNNKILNIYNIINGTDYKTIQELFTANGFKNFDGEIYLVFKRYYYYSDHWYGKYTEEGGLENLVDDEATIDKLNALPKIDLNGGISYVEVTELEINATFGISTYYSTDDPTSEYYQKWYKKYNKSGGVETLSEEVADADTLARLNSSTSNIVEGSTAIKYVSFNVWQYVNNDISDQFVNDISDQFVIDMLNARKLQEVENGGSKYYYSAHWYNDASHATAVVDAKVLAKLGLVTVVSGESYVLVTRYYQNGDGWVDENGNAVNDSATLEVIGGLTIKTTEDSRKYVEYEKTYYYYTYWTNSNGDTLDESTNATLIETLLTKLNGGNSTTVGSATVKLYKNGDNWSYDENYVGGDDYYNNVKDKFIIKQGVTTTNLQQDFSVFVDGHTYYITIVDELFAIENADGSGVFPHNKEVSCENNILTFKDNKTGETRTATISSGPNAHKWVITNKINGGLPVMIKPYLTITNKIAESKYELWFDTLATLNLIVNDFNVDETSQKYYVVDGDEQLQGHVLYDSDTVILMYNTPTTSGDSKNLNSYKMSYGITSDGYYVASINGKILEISALKINKDTASQMIVASSNQDVVYVDTSNDSYITIKVRNVGQATLTFYNLKDDGINVKFNIVVVKGFTDFVVKHDKTDEMVESFNLTVGVDEDYSFGFENILNGIDYPANTSGFQVVVKSVDGNTNISTEATSSVKFGTDIIDGKMVGKTLDFNYTTTLSLLALDKVGTGEIKLSITPFVIFNNEKVFVSSLAKEITINVVVEALNVMFSEDEAKISAQNEKEISVVVYSNNGDGLQTITLSANGIEDILVDVSKGFNSSTNLVVDSTSEASLLKIRLRKYEFVKDNNAVGEVAIHRHIFTFVLSMNLEDYVNIYAKGNNPLYYDKEFVIKATSGSKESTFNFTIAPNPVSTLDAYFYPVQEENGSAFDQSDIWAIAPGKQGILKIEITPDYNNVLLVEVQLDSQYLNYVDISQQYISSMDLGNNSVTYSKLPTTNTLVGNKIILWNTIVDYPSLLPSEYGGSSSVLDMAQGEYYLLFNFRTTMPQDVYFPITVNLYDKDRNVIVSETKQLHVESFPKITATLDKYSDGIIGKGEIVPLTITAQNVDTEIKWNLRSADGTIVAKNIMYYMDNKGVLQPVSMDSEIDLSKKYYLDTNVLTYGKYTLNFSGKREINKTTFSADETVELQIVSFTLEDINELDAVDGVVTIKNATTKTLKAVATLNEKAYDYNYGVLKPKELEKYNALVSAISGSDDGVNWYVATTNGYEKLLANKIYSGFKFLTEDGLCKIKALSISTNTLRLTFHYYYDINGDIVITDQYNIEGYTVFMFDYYFTLVIEDNSSEDHPNPINTQEDLEKMQEGASYILQNDITLISWKPIDFNANYLDGNGYTLSIMSFDLTNETGSTEAYVGLFRTISENSIVKNLNINIAQLLVSSNTYNSMKNGNTTPNIDLRETELVYFGVLAGNNEGTVINVKVVNYNMLDNNNYLYVALSTGYYSVGGSQTTSTGYIGGLVGQNTGVIADSMVGVRNNGSITASVSTNESSKQVRVNGFKLAGANRVAGFVSFNAGTISNSFTSDISIVNNATITRNSHTAGFVGQNTGKVYSCAVTSNSITSFRATSTTIESLVSVGGFTYLNTGRIEDCYTNIQIKNVSTQTAGFVYENGAKGEIVNAYTTSRNLEIDKNSSSHSLFVSVKPMFGTLKNCYYAIVDNELGLGANADLEILRGLDPAVGLNLITDSVISQSYFTGFTFVSDKSSVDGVWLYNENALPTLANCENVEIYTCRELISAPSSYFVIEADASGVGTADVYDLTFSSLDTTLQIKDNTFKYYGIEIKKLSAVSSDWVYVSPLSGETITLTTTEKEGKIYYRYSDNVSTQNGTETLFNYSYTQNNPGSRNNPLVVTTAEEFAKYIVTNTQKRNGKYVFGGTTDDGDSSTARYVKVVRDLDFSDNKITYKYKISGASDQISITDIIFNGVLMGNSMTLSNIYLVNQQATESDNWGIFSQIGLGSEKNDVANAFVFNLKLNYREVSSENSRKVGVLAGTINNATITKIDIVGPQDSKESDVVGGKYMVGGLAGLIVGDNTKISEITTSNVRVMANYVTDTSSGAGDNEAFNLTENFKVDNVNYNEFSYTDSNQRVHKIGVTLKKHNYNIDWSNLNISYAGAIAGAVVGTSGVDFDYSNPSIYKKDENDPTYANLRTGRTTIQNLTVKDNLAVNSMVSGGVFGYLGGKYSLNGVNESKSDILIVKDVKVELNSDNLNQSVFGMAYAGGIVGYSYKAALIESRIEHAETIQETIDAQINTITAGNVSANNFFVNNLGDVSSRNIAIGGLVGYSNMVAIVDSYSKLNVINPYSYIAGGLVGQAVGMLYMAYDYTIGDVDASTMIGGAIGYKMYGKKGGTERERDLYLINVVSSNVWSNNVVTYVNDINKFLNFAGSTRSENSMFEIGNITGAYTYSPTTESARFRYLGSLIGRVSCATLGEGSTVEETPANNINSGSSSYIGATDYLVSAYTPGYRENISGTREERYATIYTNNFFNVISSTYGGVSHTGSLNNENYTSKISNNALSLYCRSISETTNDTITRYTEEYTSPYRIGKQYYISYITGDYLISNPSGTDLGNFKNEFMTNWGFIVDISEYTEADMQNKVFTISNPKASTIWYVNTKLYLPRYGYNTTSNVIEINNDDDLKTALTFGYKDKIYKINKNYKFIDVATGNEVPSSPLYVELADITLTKNGGGSSGRFFDRSVEISFTEIPYKVTIENTDINLSSCVFFANSVVSVNVTLLAASDSSNYNGMYNILSGCNFTNVKFNINATKRVGLAGGKSGIGTSHSEGYLGLFANNTSGCNFTNCEIIINIPDTIQLISYDNNTLNVSTYGHIIGRAYRSSFTNCKLQVNGGSTIVSNKDTIANAGGIIGNLLYSNIDGITYKIGSVDYKITSNKDTISLGGFAGTSQGSVIGALTATDENITATVTKGASSSNIYIGGVFGRVAIDGSSFANSKFNKIRISGVSIINASGVTKNAKIVGIGAIVGSSSGVGYSEVDALGCNVTIRAISNTDKEYIGLIAGYSSGDVINGVETGYYDDGTKVYSEINYTFIGVADAGNGIPATEVNSRKGIAIGGIAGLCDSSIQKTGNTAKINIIVEANETTATANSLAIGGIVGSNNKNAINIEDSYNMANIDLVNLNGGASNNFAILKTYTYVGGIIGQATKTVAFKNVANYGDILYDEQAKDSTGKEAQSNKIKLGGIIGYTTASISLNGVMDYTRFYAYSDKMEFVVKNIAGVETKITNVEIKKNQASYSAITKGLKVVEGSQNYYFVSEFDPATASDGKNKNLVNNHVSYGLLQDFNITDSNGVSLLNNADSKGSKHYLAMFTSSFESYDKFYEMISTYTTFNNAGNKNNPNNPILVTNVAANTYNVFTGDSFTTIAEGLNVGSGAILTSNKTNGDFKVVIKRTKVTTGLNLFNKNDGIISNILFVLRRTEFEKVEGAVSAYTFFMNENNGVLYNIAFVSGLTNNDKYVLNVGQSAISVISSNYGEIYKSGTMMVFVKTAAVNQDGKEEVSSVLKDDKFSNFVLYNYGTIAESYTTSKFNGTINSNVEFGALCYSNQGTIRNCLAGGRFGKTYVGGGVKAIFAGNSGSKIATCSDGEISEFVMKESSYNYTDADTVESTNKSIWVVKNGNFHINEGYPYIRNGIQIPTDPFGLKEVDIQTVAELKNMIYAFNAYDDMTGAVTPIGEGTKFNASNIQTVNFDIERDSSKKITRTFSLNLNKFGRVTGSIANVTLPNALISYNTGVISELTIDNVSVTYSNATSDAAILNAETDGGTVKNVTVKNSKLNMTNSVSNAGAVVGELLKNSIIGDITVESTTITGGNYAVGGVIGKASNKELTNLSFGGSITSGANRIGGIVAGSFVEKATNLTVQAKINHSSASNYGTKCIGGIVGYSDLATTYKDISFNASDGSYTSEINVGELHDSSTRIYIGGLIGCANNAPIKSGYWKAGSNSKQLKINLKAESSSYCAGGLIGRIFTNEDITYNFSDETNILMDASGVLKNESASSGFRSVKDMSLKDFYIPTDDQENDLFYGGSKSLANNVQIYKNGIHKANYYMYSRFAAVESNTATDVGRVVGSCGEKIKINIQNFNCKITNLRTYYSVLRINNYVIYYTVWGIVLLAWIVESEQYVVEQKYLADWYEVIQTVDGGDKLITGHDYVDEQILRFDYVSMTKDERFKDIVGTNNINAFWQNSNNQENVTEYEKENLIAFSYSWRKNSYINLGDWLYGRGDEAEYGAPILASIGSSLYYL